MSWLERLTCGGAEESLRIHASLLRIGQNFGAITDLDVSPDGECLLMLETDDPNVQLVIALNWAASVKARTAAR